MSLVSEALKKARNEAARREASERGLAYPTVPHHLPVQRPERRVWPWAVGSGALVALVLGALAAVLAGRAPAPPPAAATSAPPAQRTVPPSVAEHEAPAVDGVPRIESSPLTVATPTAVQPTTPPAATAPAAAAPTPTAETRPVAAAVSAPRSAPISIRATVPTSAPTAEPAPSAPAGRIAEPTAAPAPSSAPPAPAASAPVAQATPLTFVRHADLPDGVRLDLGGIAFSSGWPVALINGRALGPGEQILGYTLTKIEPDVVLLEKAGVRVRLALKD